MRSSSLPRQGDGPDALPGSFVQRTPGAEEGLRKSMKGGKSTAKNERRRVKEQPMRTDFIMPKTTSAMMTNEQRAEKRGSKRKMKGPEHFEVYKTKMPEPSSA